ncbi:MAG: KH domain-containing protein [Acholeplasmatales bacterium]|jgi:spoIIIJ-associated protein|nr:KH domain-containing protein [Acholeplasmatales bacterium]
MIKNITVEGKNIEELKKQAVLFFGVSENRLRFENIKETKALFSGETKMTADVTFEINLAVEGKRYLETILNNLGVTYKMEMRNLDDGKDISYNIESEENSLLIGREGRTLIAIQSLVRNYITSFTDEKIQVTVDIGSYFQTRKKQLEIMAVRTAKEVAQTKIPASFDPMSPYDRLIIHTRLSNSKDVYTESEGEENARHIVIKPRKSS